MIQTYQIAKKKKKKTWRTTLTINADAMSQLSSESQHGPPQFPTLPKLHERKKNRRVAQLLNKLCNMDQIDVNEIKSKQRIKLFYLGNRRGYLQRRDFSVALICSSIVVSEYYQCLFLGLSNATAQDQIIFNQIILNTRKKKKMISVQNNET